MSLPALPDGQRWSINKQFFFVVVRLQERRWWGWRTIASATETVDRGPGGVAACVDLILRRDYYDELMAERAEKRRRRADEIPYGNHYPRGNVCCPDFDGPRCALHCPEPD